MSRKPFSMPAGCPPVSVVLVVPSSVLFCTLPSFALPTFAHTPNILPPDVAPPRDCYCMDIEIKPRMAILNYGAVLPAPIDGIQICPATGHFTNQSPDCCDPKPRIDVSLDVPCMPLTIAGTGVIRLTSAAEPTIKAVIAKQTGACALTYNLDIAIPCVPFSLDAVQDKTATISRDPAKPVSLSYNVGLKKTGCDVGITMGLHLNIPPFPSFPSGWTVPPMPSGWTPSDPPYWSPGMKAEVNFHVTCGTPLMSQTFDFAALDKNWVLKTHLEVPCRLSFAAANVTPSIEEVEPGVDPYFHNSLSVAQDCCAAHLTGSMSIGVRKVCAANITGVDVTVVSDVQIVGGQFRVYKRVIKALTVQPPTMAWCADIIQCG